MASQPSTHTILISITHGFQARNLLQTDVASRLVQQRCKLIVVSPMAASDEFRAQFREDGIEFVVGDNSGTRLSTFFSVARRYALANPRRNATNNLFNEK